MSTYVLKSISCSPNALQVIQTEKSKRLCQHGYEAGKNAECLYELLWTYYVKLKIRSCIGHNWIAINCRTAKWLDIINHSHIAWVTLWIFFFFFAFVRIISGLTYVAFPFPRWKRIGNIALNFCDTIAWYVCHTCMWMRERKTWYFPIRLK